MPAMHGGPDEEVKEKAPRGAFSSLVAARSAFQNRRHAHAAAGADGYEAAALALLGEYLGERADDAATGGAEGMRQRHAATLDVELLAIDGAQGSLAAEAGTAVFVRFPGL